MIAIVGLPLGVSYGIYTQPASDFILEFDITVSEKTMLSVVLAVIDHNYKIMIMKFIACRYVDLLIMNPVFQHAFNLGFHTHQHQPTFTFYYKSGTVMLCVMLGYVRHHNYKCYQHQHREEVLYNLNNTSLEHISCRSYIFLFFRYVRKDI